MRKNLSIFKKSKFQDQAAFLDVNIFAHEGFTSGALIQMREILRRLIDLGIPAGVLSVAHGSLSPNWERGKGISKSITFRNNIPVEECLIEKSFKENLGPYREVIQELINGYKWRVIFMNTPAVYLEKVNLIAMEEAIRSGAEVVSLLPDVLYPSYAKHPKKEVDRFYSLLKKTRVLTPSRFLINRFFKDTGIKAELFPNLFTTDEIIARRASRKYITLINHHQMKGVVIFHEIAKKMPEEQFLIVENWPDVPLYSPPTPNIKFSKFITDIRKLYGQTKILLVPSLCEEGGSRVITEALLNGVPVIAHNIGGMPEVGLGAAMLVDPPPIEGITILPEVSLTNLDKQANKFVELIRKITKDPKTLKVSSRHSKQTALKYCRRSEKIFEGFVEDWFSSKK